MQCGEVAQTLRDVNISKVYSHLRIRHFYKRKEKVKMRNSIPLHSVDHDPYMAVHPWEKISCT